MPSSMELFGALMSGSVPTRVPLSINLFDQGAVELQMTTEQYYSRAEHVVKGQIALHKRFKGDVLWGTHYIARQAEMLGSERTIYPACGAPNVGRLVIQNHRDIESLRIPDELEAHPAMAIQLETIKRLVEYAGGETPVFAFQVGTFTLPIILMGIDAWFELLLTGPSDLAEELLTKCSEFSVKTFNAYKNAGAAMMIYANPGMSTDFFPMELLEERALSRLAADARQMGPEQLVYFCGGNRIGSVLPMILNNTGIGAFYLHPDDDIIEAKKLVAGRALIAGSVNDILLARWTPEQIHQEVRRIMEQGAPGGGFILGTLMTPCNIPAKNIHTLIEAAHRYGAYPQLDAA